MLKGCGVSGVYIYIYVYMYISKSKKQQTAMKDVKERKKRSDGNDLYLSLRG